MANLKGTVLICHRYMADEPRIKIEHEMVLGGSYMTINIYDTDGGEKKLVNNMMFSEHEQVPTISLITKALRKACEGIDKVLDVEKVKSLMKEYKVA